MQKRGKCTILVLFILLSSMVVYALGNEGQATGKEFKSPTEVQDAINDPTKEVSGSTDKPVPISGGTILPGQVTVKNGLLTATSVQIGDRKSVV